MNVLIAEGMAQEGKSILMAHGFKCLEPSDQVDMDLIDVIVVRSVFQINAQTVRLYPKLKLVAKLGTGLDNIDKAYCEKNYIKVISAPGLNAISTAEFTVTQILNIFKNTYKIYNAVKGHDYRRSLYYGREMQDLTVAVLGYGNVGHALVDRIAPFVGKVLIKDNGCQKILQEGKCHFVVTMQDFLPTADIVVLALPLAGNQKIVNNNFLTMLKSNVVLINAARGGLIDEAALEAFLRSHPDAFYYCDVIEEEPNYTLKPEEQQYQHPLLALPNVLFTPHLAGMTKECQEKIAVKIVDDIISFSQQTLQGKR